MSLLEHFGSRDLPGSASSVGWIQTSSHRSPDPSSQHSQVGSNTPAAERTTWGPGIRVPSALLGAVSPKPLRPQMLACSVVVQLLSHTQLFVTHGQKHTRLPCPSLSQSLLKLMSIESVMPSNHLILCRPLLLLPSIFPSIRVFSSELALCIRWPKYCSFSFSISPSSGYSVSRRKCWLVACGEVDDFSNWDSFLVTLDTDP